MEVFVIFALFVFGTALGSFLGVLVSRYSPERPLFSKSLLGRSRCISCTKTLHPAHLIPIVSFIFLRGKCGMCKTKISIQTFFVEIMSGAIVAGVPVFLVSFYKISFSQFFLGGSMWWQYCLVGFWVIVFLGWFAMVLIDVKYYIIPDEFHALFVILGVAISSIMVAYRGELFPFRESFLMNYVLIFSPFGGIIANRVLGCVVSGLFFLVLFFVSGGRGMGMGDVKLAFSAGILLGWPDMGLSIILSFIIGGVFSTILFLSGKKTMKDRVPFAPFLVAGFVISVFFGQALMSGYFGLFGL